MYLYSWPEQLAQMKLSTLMAIAMIALFFATAVAIGEFTYRNLEAAMLPRSLERVQLDLRLLTAELASYVSGARQDIVGFRFLPWRCRELCGPISVEAPIS